MIIHVATLLPLIKSALLSIILNIVGNVAYLAVAAIASVVAARYLGASKQKDIQYLEGALILTKAALTPVLKDKTNSVFAYWIAGLVLLGQGKITEETKIDLLNFIEKAAKADNLELLPEEINAIQEAAGIFVNLMLLSKTSTKSVIEKLSKPKI